MNSYGILAQYYDRFTADVEYEKWFLYYLEIFKNLNIEPGIVLDLACGTGTMSCMLSEHGYEVVSVDSSIEMLSEAHNKAHNIDGDPPVFLNQRMQDLDLYGTIDVCVCGLDSINYITEDGDINKVFAKIKLFMNPGGVLIFDINTASKFNSIDGLSFVREDIDVYCAWHIDVCGDIVNYDFDIFEYSGGNNWVRHKEHHKERIYDINFLRDILLGIGFSDVMVYSPHTFDEAVADDDRVFFVVRN